MSRLDEEEGFGQAEAEVLGAGCRWGRTWYISVIEEEHA